MESDRPENPAARTSQQHSAERAPCAPIKISPIDNSGVEVPWEEDGGGKRGGWGGTFLVWLAVIFGILFVYHYPATHFEKIRQAVIQGNVDFLEQNIDFGSIKTQLLSEGMLAMGREGRAVKQEYVAKLDDYVGEHISPRGIISIARLTRDNRPPLPWQDGGWGEFPETKVEKWFYRNLDEVEFELGDGAVVFLERTGVLRWRVFRVVLPTEVELERGS
jgi:hypothetical protein